MNDMARELCEHISHNQPLEGIRPAAVVACVPMVDRNGNSLQVSDADVAEVIKEALSLPVEPLEETLVPSTLITKDELNEKISKTNPEWV
jgi:hypothetical protein